MGQDLETFENQQKEMRKVLKEHPNVKLYVIQP